jgi:transcriptional regulator GlxA family with amidase domain
MKMAKMSENSIKVINFLKENHGKKMTSQEVAEALDMSTATVNGVFTALSNKELGYREEATVKGAVDISFLAITEDGKTADVSEISENGQAIIAYLKDVRIKHAIQLLLTFNLTVTKIATACGYSSTSYFIQDFNKVIGESPTEYRKRLISTP